MGWTSVEIVFYEWLLVQVRVVSETMIRSDVWGIDPYFHSAVENCRCFHVFVSFLALSTEMPRAVLEEQRRAPYTSSIMLMKCKFLPCILVQHVIVLLPLVVVWLYWTIMLVTDSCWTFTLYTNVIMKVYINIRDSCWKFALILETLFCAHVITSLLHAHVALCM